jgi:integrase
VSRGARIARGTLEHRGTRWFLRIRDVKVDPATGAITWKRCRIELGTDVELRSEAAARRDADAWIARRYPERQRAGRQILFAAAAERFLEEHVVLMRRSSRQQYSSVLRAHLVPYFASHWLHAIDTAAVRTFIAKVAIQDLSRNTVANIRRTLLHLLREARAAGLDVGLIESSAIRPPKDDRPPRERRYLDAQELDAILAASAPPWRGLWAVLGLLGLRISEALGLTWEAIDLQGRDPVVHVRQSAARGVLLPLKTAVSKATLPLPAPLVAILEEHRAAWTSNAAGLLFATRIGGPLNADSVRRRRWHPLLKRLAIPPAGLHAPRHGLPRRLFEAGASPEVVRRMMRHADLKTTQLYSHAEARDLRAAIDAAVRN